MDGGGWAWGGLGGWCNLLGRVVVYGLMIGNGAREVQAGGGTGGFSSQAPCELVTGFVQWTAQT